MIITDKLEPGDIFINEFGEKISINSIRTDGRVGIIVNINYFSHHRKRVRIEMFEKKDGEIMLEGCTKFVPA